MKRSPSVREPSTVADDLHSSSVLQRTGLSEKERQLLLGRVGTSVKTVFNCKEPYYFSIGTQNAAFCRNTRLSQKIYTLETEWIPSKLLNANAPELKSSASIAVAPNQNLLVFNGGDNNEFHLFDGKAWNNLSWTLSQGSIPKLNSPTVVALENSQLAVFGSEPYLYFYDMHKKTWKTIPSESTIKETKYLPERSTLIIYGMSGMDCLNTKTFQWGCQPLSALGLHRKNIVTGEKTGGASIKVDPSVPLRKRSTVDTNPWKNNATKWEALQTNTQADSSTNTTIPLWPFLLCVVLILSVVVGFLFVILKKMKRKGNAQAFKTTYQTQTTTVPAVTVWDPEVTRMDHHRQGTSGLPRPHRIIDDRITSSQQWSRELLSMPPNTYTRTSSRSTARSHSSSLEATLV